MKLVKPGRKQTGWSKECECTGEGNGKGGCGSVLLVEQADLFITSSGGSYCESDDTFHDTFRCIQCGVLTDIKGVPSHAKPRFRESESHRRCDACKGIGIADGMRCRACGGNGAKRLETDK